MQKEGIDKIFYNYRKKAGAGKIAVAPIFPVFTDFPDQQEKPVFFGQLRNISMRLVHPEQTTQFRFRAKSVKARKEREGGNFDVEDGSCWDQVSVVCSGQ